MNTVPARPIAWAACLAIAVSAWAGAHAKTDTRPVVVPAHQVKPVATKAPKTQRVQAMPAVARDDNAMRTRSIDVVDTDGSRFRYDSCGCSAE